jgi:hypothetical protein
MPAIHFASIHEALAGPTSAHFWLAREGGTYSSGDPESFYRLHPEDDDLSFDIANNQALAHVAPNGAIRHVVFYRGNARVDSHFPGMWVAKLFSQEGPYAFRLILDGALIRLDQVDWAWHTGLLGNVFPLTELRGERVTVRLLTYAPMSADGRERLRGLVYGALIENTSSEPVRGAVLLPEIESQVTFSLDNQSTVLSFVETQQPPRRALVSTTPGQHQWELVDPDRATAGKGQRLTEAVDFELAPGEWLWAPVVISAVGEPTAERVAELGTLAWLEQTWSYFQGLTGRLEMPGDPFAAEFFARTVHQCLECVGFDRDGWPVGSDLGTSPTTDVICMKDLYYSVLPFAQLDPEFLKLQILWFLQYNERPAGNKFGAGGVRHSLSNALTPALLAGLYYDATGDHAFYLEHPEVRRGIERILQRMLAARTPGGPMLFPSRFISDGPALGDYHTGSNVCAWYACDSAARWLGDIYHEQDEAHALREAADQIKADIERLLIVQTPLGEHYNEGANADGSTPVLGHEGEESDTTLMPFYGFTAFDAERYRAFLRFSLSEHNRFYTPHLKGLKFAVEEGAITEATFPGYVIGLALAEDAASLSGPQGALTEIRRHTDVDGSMWWWPYYRHGTYGEVVRINHEITLYPGKCGWASGVYVALFIAYILGLDYRGAERRLRFRPLSPASDFTWERFRMGYDTFSVSFARTACGLEASVTNHNQQAVTVAFELPLRPGQEATTVQIDGLEASDCWKSGTFMGRQTVIIERRLGTAERLQVSIVAEPRGTQCPSGSAGAAR